MNELIAHLWQSLLNIFGIGHFTAAGLAVWAVGMVLTMAWLIGANKGVRKAVGVIGGPAITLATMGLGITLIYGFVSILLTLASNLLIGAVANIPLIGTTLARICSWLIAGVLKVVLLISIGWYLLKNLSRVSETMIHSITQPMQKGHDKLHLFAGAATIALLINHPSFNSGAYFVPMVLSSVFGLYTLIKIRPKWSQIMRQVEVGHVVEFGTLAYGRKAKTEEDAQLLREAEIEIEKYLSGEAFAEEIERKCAVRKRITEQLELFNRQAPPSKEDEAVSARLAQLQAEMDAAEEEAEAQAETDEEERRTHLH